MLSALLNGLLLRADQCKLRSKDFSVEEDTDTWKLLAKKPKGNWNECCQKRSSFLFHVALC